jgi:hypothetical protein
MESPVQHVGRHRRFAYQNHRKEPVEWRYHIGDDVFVTIKAPFPFVHISKHSIPACDRTYRPTKRGVALHFGEWKELKHIIPCWKKKSQNWDSWFHCIE